MLVYILWFVITVGPGHLMHFPMDGPPYATKDDCKEAAAELLKTLEKQWPDDPNLEVYCTKEKLVSVGM